MGITLCEVIVRGGDFRGSAEVMEDNKQGEMLFQTNSNRATGKSAPILFLEIRMVIDI
jgi:hypothetical protein